MASPAAAPVPGAGYFVDQKKGEVNELKQLLKNINIERDVNRKREIIKKVIAYMTLGIDVSRLFTDMVMAIETKDLVIKKMIYLYLSNYARSQPDVAIMCINTLRRDCDNEDPMVRGLALRSLSSLRMESVLEYIELPLKKALTDISAYVRKTAVMGVLKIYSISPQLMMENGYLAILKQMLYDVDTSVITNVILALDEIEMKGPHGGLEITAALMMHLLNKISDFSEWGLNLLLDLVCRYSPQSEDEVFAIMNILDPVLRTSNSGVVLAAIKCFMHLTNFLDDMQRQVILRAKPPMLTLVTGGCSEVQFTVLKHMQVLIPRAAARGVFDDEYRQFFVRYNEPSHVKHLKVDLLPYIANSSNVRDISSELSEYVTDVDAELSKRAIGAMGDIAINLPDMSNEMVVRIVELIDLDMQYVRVEAIKTIGKVLRVLPDMRVHVIPSMSRYLKICDNADAKTVLVWMLGEFGSEIIEAPYLLEPVIDEYSELESPVMKMQLLSSSVKLFFKRPPEMQRMLGRLFSAAINDTSHQDVHDRALLLYRLFTSNIEVAREVLACTGGLKTGRDGDANSHFSEEVSDEIRNEIFAEFNSLSIIFGKPAIQFVDEKYYQEISASANAKAFATQAPPPQVKHIASPVQAAPPAAVAVANPPRATQVVNLLDWDEPAPPTRPNDSAPQLLQLQRDFELSPQLFQQLWTSLPAALDGRLCSFQHVPGSSADVEQALRAMNVVTMASGPLSAPQAGMKFFFYASELGDLLNPSPRVYLVQATLNSLNGEFGVVIKIQGGNGDSSRFRALLTHALVMFSPQL